VRTIRTAAAFSSGPYRRVIWRLFLRHGSILVSKVRASSISRASQQITAALPSAGDGHHRGDVMRLHALRDGRPGAVSIATEFSYERVSAVQNR
jgi:hypothetical protein